MQPCYYYFLRFKNEYNPINLNRIQYFIDSKRIDPNEKITMDILVKSGAVNGKVKDGIKLLGGVSGFVLCTFLYKKHEVQILLSLVCFSY